MANTILSETSKNRNRCVVCNSPTDICTEDKAQSLTRIAESFGTLTFYIEELIREELPYLLSPIHPYLEKMFNLRSQLCKIMSNKKGVV